MMILPIRYTLFFSFVFLLGCVSDGIINNQQKIKSYINKDSSIYLPINYKRSIKIKEKQAPYNDIWQKIRANLSFPISNHPIVKNRMQWYLKQPNYMSEIATRAKPFLYYIVEQVEHRGLPIELALMPLIESDFDTSAYSHKHASGLWQLTPLIAKHYGVKITPWYDGRQDIIESTNAALDFLTHLHKRFDGNWFHAIAAYNSGEGRVANAIKKNREAGKSSEFFTLQLPTQTKHYVPKLLAAIHLLHQQKMNFPKIKNESVITTIPLKNDVILKNNVASQQLKKLNPGYTRFPALLDGAQHIVVEKKDAGMWLSELALLPMKQNLQWQTHIIQPGETLGSIALKYFSTVTDIKQLNQLDDDIIYQGDTLILPITSNGRIDYQVRSGDSLWLIAKQFNVSVNKLKNWNHLSKNSLQIGEKLTIFLNAP